MSPILKRMNFDTTKCTFQFGPSSFETIKDVVDSKYAKALGIVYPCTADPIGPKLSHEITGIFYSLFTLSYVKVEFLKQISLKDEKEKFQGK